MSESDSQEQERREYRRKELVIRIASNKRWLETHWDKPKAVRRECQENLEADERELAKLDAEGGAWQELTAAAQSIPDEDVQNTLANFRWLAGAVTITTELGIAEPTEADVVNCNLDGPSPWICIRVAAWWSPERNGRDPDVTEWRRFLPTKASIVEIRNAIEELQIEARAAIENARTNPKKIQQSERSIVLGERTKAQSIPVVIAPDIPVIPDPLAAPMRYAAGDLDDELLAEICGALLDDGRYCGRPLGMCREHDVVPNPLPPYNP